MSKRSRITSRRSSFPWPLAVFGGIVLILSIVLFARGSREQPAPDVAAGAGLGQIAVDQDKIDFGYVRFGTNETFRIKVTNTGKGALRFSEAPYIEVMEGC